MAGRRNTRRWNASKKKIAKPKVKTKAAARALAWTRWHKKNPDPYADKLDSAQERLLEAIVLVASNDGDYYRDADPAGAVTAAISSYQRRRSDDLRYDLRVIRPLAVKAVWHGWSRDNPRSNTRRNAPEWHVVVYEPDGTTLGSMGPFSKAGAKKKASYMRGKGKTATLIQGGGKASKKAPRKAARRKASKPTMKPSTAGYALAYKRWHGSNPRRRNSYAEGTIGRWEWAKHANGTTLWQFLGGRGLYHFIETPGESVVLYAEMGQDVKPHKVGTFWSAAAARSEAATLDKHGTRSRSRSNPRRNSRSRYR